MIIDNISVRDIHNKLQGTIVSMSYNRHPSKRRLGIIRAAVNNNTTKVKVELWDYKQGRFSTRLTHHRLSGLKIYMPKSGYFRISNRVVFVNTDTLQRNRYSYGCNINNIMGAYRMKEIDVLRLYDIYERITDDEIINNDYAYINNNLIYKGYIQVDSMGEI